MAGGTLLIGYGNPGRGDDGLGPAFARRIAALHLPGLTVEIDYQLTVDHALMLSGADRVVFADAALDAGEPFYFRTLTGAAAAELGSHAVSPDAALALARLLFGAAPQGFVLGLRGASFGAMAEGLSPMAEASLDAAEVFFGDWYRQQPVIAGVRND
jgi:hydrogenase maturation protease